MRYGRLMRMLCVIGLVATSAFAQKMISSTPNRWVTQPLSGSMPGTTLNYYSSKRSVSTHIPPPAAFLQKQSASARQAASKTQFIVNYTNFPASAKQAFQYAVDIWSTLITSSVPIHIQANWTADEPNLLGSAGPTSYRYNFDGAQKAVAFYPIALAEKIARRELNNPNEADIIANFNRNNEWYFGTDGLTPKDKTDLVTVVLHELAHSLGMIGFFNARRDDTGKSIGEYLADLPSVYDCFIENGQPVKRLVASQKDYPNRSTELNQQLTGNDLFINGVLLRQNAGQKLRLHAKAIFDRASSIYHLDEDAYPPGNISSLMTPMLGLGESIHSPGPYILQLFADLEWVTTSLLHTPIRNSEDVNDLVFSAQIVSDTTVIAGTEQLFYRKSPPNGADSSATSVALTRIGTTNEYRYTLPAAQASGDFWYYFQVQDASGRTFLNPGRNTIGGKTWHYLRIGPDNTPPIIQYSPTKNYIFSTTVADSLPLHAYIADSQTNIASAIVEYQINGVAQPTLPLSYSRLSVGSYTYDSVYVNRIALPANSLKPGDKITYRIVARDASRAGNQAVSPATGTYQLSVVSPQAVRDQYITMFNDAKTADDFVGYGFSIKTPTEFGDPAIHSEHPYPNGNGFNSQSDLEYVLLAPIRIKANPDSATIRFDEVVLVEPGDAELYDYVTVEGSADNGRTWKPLVDNYSASAKPEWLNIYNNNLVAGLYGEQNSKAVGLPALFRRREIALLKSGSPFKAGDQLLIRFRLHSDRLAYGWGWAIDNLRIQAPAAPLVLANEPLLEGQFSVYPNPVSKGVIQVRAELPKPVSTADLTLTSLTGQVHRQLTLKVGGAQIREQVNVGQLPTGVYFLHLNASDMRLTRKVIIVE